MIAEQMPGLGYRAKVNDCRIAARVLKLFLPIGTAPPVREQVQGKLLVPDGRQQTPAASQAFVEQVLVKPPGSMPRTIGGGRAALFNFRFSPSVQIDYHHTGIEVRPPRFRLRPRWEAVR